MQNIRNVRMLLACAAAFLALRLCGNVLTEPIRSLFEKEQVAAFLLYLETGRAVKTGAPLETAPPTTATAPTLPPETAEATQPPAEPERKPLSLSKADTKTVNIKNSSGQTADAKALLLKPLDWDLTQSPQVLLLHTHATESFTPTKEAPYEASSYYRTLDTDHNMVRIGSYLAALLKEGGVESVHDTTLHDYPSYTGSYGNSRKTFQKRLEETPGLKLVLDLHRDALETESGKQLPARVQVDGRQVAQIMLVVGTGSGGLKHPNWQENLALALKLQNRLEKRCPGICRYISLRSERFNQDLSPGTVLVEVGTAGNTLEEALAATEILAQAILDLSKGTTADSAS